MKKNVTKTPSKKSSEKATKLPKLSPEQLKEISGGATKLPGELPATY